jgi:hypothetical protein
MILRALPFDFARYNCRRVPAIERPEAPSRPDTTIALGSLNQESAASKNPNCCPAANSAMPSKGRPAKLRLARTLVIGCSRPA